MPNDFLQLWLIPWATLAVSLFNTVLLFWLGLTVLLSAQTRNWGNTLAGFGLLLGGAFFLAHSAALDYSLEALLDGSPTWWMFVAIPLLALPFGWLILMLWSCGFWDEPKSRLARRARFPLATCIALFLVLVGLCIYGAPHQGRLPYGDLAKGNGPTYLATRAIALLYPPFLLLCTGAALYALTHPAPTGQMMTQEARRRARPFLLISSLVQVVVSVGVALTLATLGYMSLSTSLYGLYNTFSEWLNAADLAVSLAISVAVMLLGKAIVSYEIFTGKILPRRGFLRQWRAIVTLAACYAMILSASLGFELRAIFPILLTTTLMSAFLAIFSARATLDHERAIQSIAPFVASQHLTPNLLSGESAPLQRGLDEPFRALCEDVLGASRAALIARGAHATLCGAPRLYPPSLPLRLEWAPLVADLHTVSNEAMPLPLDSGMNYLVPLGVAPGQSADGEGPLGALLLGPKRDGGLYTVEEIEVARATGQHLLDSQAGATLAARLVELQRHKLAQVQTLDRRARRALHDDILPLLHGALLELSAQNAPPGAMALLTDAHKGISELLREAPSPDSPLARRDFFEALKREIEGEMPNAFAEVNWRIAPEAHDFARQLPSLLADTLFFAAREAIRNAARYGRGGDATRALNLCLEAGVEGDFTLEICDDGVGTGAAAPSVSGSGSGLSLHAAMLAIAGGFLRLEEAAGGGTRVVLGLPGSLAPGADLGKV